MKVSEWLVDKIDSTLSRLNRCYAIALWCVVIVISNTIVVRTMDAYAFDLVEDEDDAVETVQPSHLAPPTRQRMATPPRAAPDARLAIIRRAPVSKPIVPGLSGAPHRPVASVLGSGGEQPKLVDFAQFRQTHSVPLPAASRATVAAPPWVPAPLRQPTPTVTAAPAPVLSLPAMTDVSTLVDAVVEDDVVDEDVVEEELVAGGERVTYSGDDFEEGSLSASSLTASAPPAAVAGSVSSHSFDVRGEKSVVAADSVLPAIATLWRAPSAPTFMTPSDAAALVIPELGKELNSNYTSSAPNAVLAAAQASRPLPPQPALLSHPAVAAALQRYETALLASEDLYRRQLEITRTRVARARAAVQLNSAKGALLAVRLTA